MTGAVRQMASSARPSITTGSEVRTATELVAEVGSADDGAAVPRRMQASANVRANGGMGLARITVERLDRLPCPKVGSEKPPPPTRQVAAYLGVIRSSPCMTR